MLAWSKFGRMLHDFAFSMKNVFRRFSKHVGGFQSSNHFKIFADLHFAPVLVLHLVSIYRTYNEMYSWQTAICQQYFDDRARGQVAIFLNTDWHMEGWENNLNSFTRTLESKDRCFSTNRRTRWIISLSDLLSAIDVRLVVHWKQWFDPLISCLLKTHPDGPDWISDISSIPVL